MQEEIFYASREKDYDYFLLRLSLVEEILHDEKEKDISGMDSDFRFLRGSIRCYIYLSSGLLILASDLDLSWYCGRNFFLIFFYSGETHILLLE